jgi:hypothetical protein
MNSGDAYSLDDVTLDMFGVTRITALSTSLILCSTMTGKTPVQAFRSPRRIVTAVKTRTNHQTHLKDPPELAK